MKHLQTPRLTLRPLALSDAPNLVHHLSDWSVIRWLSGPPWPFTIRDAQNFLGKAHKDCWAIDDGTGLIGVISCAPDLGYWLAREKHGQGLMSEAVSAVLTYYFSTRDSVLVSGHFPGNVASRAVLLKHGFRDTHISRMLSHPLGRETDVQRMELSADRWHSLRTASQ